MVALHILFPSRYDNCEHVHHVLVHFENPKGAEGAHHHLQFRTDLCHVLLQNWSRRENTNKPILPRLLIICCPSYNAKQRDCFICRKKTNFFCYLCDCKFMYVKHGCYERAHTPLHYGRL